MCRGLYIHYFKISPISAVLSFLKIISTLKDTPSHISMDSEAKGFISPESFLNFFPKPVYSTMVAEKFQIYSIKLLQIHLWVKNLNLFIFLMTPKQNSPPDFYNYPPGRWELPIAPEQRFLKIFCPEQKRGWGDYGVEKITKLNKGQGYWSQVLINFTIFATFTFLFYILLCYNLASSMLKCEGSLT